LAATLQWHRSACAGWWGSLAGGWSM